MEKVMKSFQSIKISMIISFLLSLILSQTIYFGISKIIDDSIINLITPKPEAVTSIGKRIIYVYGENVDYSDVNINNEEFINLLRIVKNYIPIIIFGICIILTSIIFYNVKLKKPLDSLNIGIKKIQNQDLDFSIEIKSNDEISNICKAFEDMRQYLSNTFKKLWKLQEEQKNLYRVFAHDLRTPLTVIKGNNEIISIMDSKDIDKIKYSAELSNIAIRKIEIYTDNLKDLQNIDNWILKINYVNMSEFTNILKNQMNILSDKYNKETFINSNVTKILSFDNILIMRVLDNIIENALRFSCSKVWLDINFNKDILEFTVCDDGMGFNIENLKYAVEPFYSSDKSRGHLGLGLTISEKLLNIYESKLEISNLDANGSKINFKINLKV